jgi:gas vesicle protein
MDENSSDFGAFLAGFVIGGLVGAATALILAPQSGEQMRGQIASKGHELRQASEERVQHYRELADTYTEEYRQKADEVISEARERVAQTGEAIQEQARIILEPGKGKNDQEPDEETAVA